MSLLEDLNSVRLPGSLDDAINTLVKNLPHHYESKSDFIRIACVREVIRVKNAVRASTNFDFDVEKIKRDAEVIINTDEVTKI